MNGITEGGRRITRHLGHIFIGLIVGFGASDYPAPAIIATATFLTHQVLESAKRHNTPDPETPPKRYDTRSRNVEGFGIGLAFGISASVLWTVLG